MKHFILMIVSACLQYSFADLQKDGSCFISKPQISPPAPLPKSPADGSKAGVNRRSIPNAASNSYAERKEYVLLVSTKNVVIIDPYSYTEVTSYESSELFGPIAVIGETFYHVDQISGSIKSIPLEHILSASNLGLGWEVVGWFRNETSVDRHAAAMEPDGFYFATFNGHLYKYNVKLKTTTQCAKLPPNNYHNSLVIADGVLYINGNTSIHAFDGTTIKELKPLPKPRFFPVLFEFRSKACCVGGDMDDGFSNHSVYCYDSKSETWTVVSHANEARQNPAVAATKTATFIFGGNRVYSNGSFDFLQMPERFDHNTLTWGYIRNISSMLNGTSYSAISFKYAPEEHVPPPIPPPGPPAEKPPGSPAEKPPGPPPGVSAGNPPGAPEGTPAGAPAGTAAPTFSPSPDLPEQN